ncbi:MAG TPA: LON peptidase substrate-binding domain-containing protein, partial [Promineifilum sp.]|nr:LON peptidase substrate-binding domain-containing protein [Promineifilum sp.]
MDDFDFSQFPDFPELFPDLGEDIFDQPVTKDKDGIIECPFLALRDIVLFPQMVMPLFIGRERSLAAINAANTKRENLIVATQRDSNVVDPDESGLFEIGTETTIGRLLRMP